MPSQRAVTPVVPASPQPAAFRTLVHNRVRAAQAVLATGRITAARAVDNLDAATTVLLAAQDDPAIGNVDLPKNVRTREEAEAWFRDTGWTAYVIEQNGRPAAILSYHKPDLTENAEGFEDVLEIDQYVLPEFRGQGIPERGWDEISKTLPKGTRLFAEVWCDNDRALAWHRKHGWEHVGTAYWEDEHDPDNNGMCERFIKTL